MLIGDNFAVDDMWFRSTFDTDTSSGHMEATINPGVSDVMKKVLATFIRDWADRLDPPTS